MILVFSWYPFEPNLFQALHGASMRHSLNVLAVQVKVCLGSSSAKLRGSSNQYQRNQYAGIHNHNDLPLSSTYFRK